MPLITTSNLFYLGNLTITDTDDGLFVPDYSAENPTAILGTYNKPPIIEVTNHDLDSDGAIADDEDNPFGDYMSYDVGAGTVSQYAENTQYYTATVLYGDGSTLTYDIMVIQMQNGDTFAVDLNGGDQLEGASIQSITLDAPSTDNWGGHLTSNTVNGASVVCFGAETCIATPDGHRRIDQICVGDLVTTYDHGDQPVLDVVHTHMLSPKHNAPVQIASGSLGPNLPRRRLRVSPQHRLLVNAGNVAQLSGAPEALIAAKHIGALPGITQALPFVPVTYVHLRFARHELIWAEGILCESLFLGPQACTTLEMRDTAQMTPARQFLERKFARRYAAHLLRHRTKNAPFTLWNETRYPTGAGDQFTNV